MLLNEKEMRQIGKQGLKWQRTRRAWFKENPPNYQGYYECAICRKWIKNPDLDHIKKRGSHPQLRYELSNLRPLCRPCHIKVT